MKQEIKFTDWNKLFELNKKVECGNKEASKLLKDLISELKDEDIITERNNGYLISRNGILQDYFTKSKRMLIPRFSDENVAYDFTNFLRERDKDSNYSVVSI